MKRIVFCGGGTAGHVMPNLALIERLRGEYDCVYIGGDGMEKTLCEQRHVPFYRIDTVKLRRDAILKNLAIPVKLIKCIGDAKKVLREIAPDLIFSKGGFAALPVVLAAKKTPVIAHESDLTPGIVTKVSKRRKANILTAFEDTAGALGGTYVGAALDPRLYRREKTALGFADSKPVLLVMGGSLGAATINDAVASALPRLLRLFNVVHVTGKNKNSIPPALGYKPIEFCSDMPGLYAAADIAITRGGAGSLAELIALNIPAVCIPLERASRGDQIQNAEYYNRRGAIEVLREGALNDKNLIDATINLYNSRSRYSAAMAKLRVDGTDKICSIIRDSVL